jgi:hypothetical protein
MRRFCNPGCVLVARHQGVCIVDPSDKRTSLPAVTIHLVQSTHDKPYYVCGSVGIESTALDAMQVIYDSLVADHPDVHMTKWTLTDACRTPPEVSRRLGMTQGFPSVEEADAFTTMWVDRFRSHVTKSLPSGTLVRIVYITSKADGNSSTQTDTHEDITIPSLGNPQRRNDAVVDFQHNASVDFDDTQDTEVHKVTKKIAKWMKEKSPPTGEITSAFDLKEGNVVWGYWKEDKRWYPGVVCTGEEETTYVQYHDKDVDDGDDFYGRTYRLHSDQSPGMVETIMMDATGSPSTRTERKRARDEFEKEDNSLGEDGVEVEVEDDVEDEVEDVEDGVSSAPAPAPAPAPPAVLPAPSGQSQSREISPRDIRAIFSNLVDTEFASDLIKSLGERVPNEKIRHVTRRLISNFGGEKCLVPQTLQLLKTYLVSSDELIDMVLTNALKDPSKLEEEKRREEQRTASRTRTGEDADQGVYYCGAKVSRDQLGQ